MTDGPPLAAGDVAEVAMISPCVGGLVRTWTPSSSRMWAVEEPDSLVSVQARGLLARSLREERRFREVGLLVESSGALVLQSRFPDDVGPRDVEVAGTVITLSDAGEPTGSVRDDVLRLLGASVRHCAESGEFLVVEQGGWDAPVEPFCLFVLVREESGDVSVIETAPDPIGSDIWGPRIVPGRASQSLHAPATPQTIDAAPFVMLDAISRWGLGPWDVAFTFGQR